jgi:hypothetical protein
MPATRIDIATRQAVAGDSLATLDEEVLARFHADADEERRNMSKPYACNLAPSGA